MIWYKGQNIREAWGFDVHRMVDPANQKKTLAKEAKRNVIAHPFGFSPRAIGIEVEVEYAEPLSNIDFSLFNVDTDGSLRPAGQGRELISVPVAGELVDHMLLQLYNGLSSLYEISPQRVHFSHRCSIHTHVDVSDFSLDQLVVFTAAYLCVENIMLSFVDELRTKNNFCAPLSTLDVTRQMIATPRMHGGTAVKYFAMNFGCASRQGTVEFRALEGTNDIVKLSKWISLCQDLVDFVAASDIVTLRKRILALNTNSEYNLFAEQALPGLVVPDYKLAMEENVALAKRIVY